MDTYNFAEETKQQEQELGVSSNFFKIKEGTNKIRILSKAILYKSDFNGRPTYKYICYVIDRSDKQIKPAFLPRTIINNVSSLQITEDYGFDGVPMPYDIVIVAKNAGTLEVEYTVTPARNNQELTDDEISLFETKKPIEEIVKGLTNKNQKIGEEEKEVEVDENDLPF